MNTLRLALLPVPALVLLTGCPGSDSDAREIIIALETNNVDVCGIDALNRLRCSNDEGVWDLDHTFVGSTSFIALSSSQRDVCALEDNDGDGAGDVYCFRPERLLSDVYEVHEGPYTHFTAVGAAGPFGQIVCGLDPDGAIHCPDAEPGSGLDTPPEGPFVDLWGMEDSFRTGICALSADGALTCFGNDDFTDWYEECPLPTSDVIDVDMGGAPFPVVLTADGALSGWSAYANDDGDDYVCLSESAVDAVAVETGQSVVCTLDSTSAISCIDIDTSSSSDTSGEDSILKNSPAGSFSLLAGNPNNVGTFMCAASGHEVTCWGDGWNDGEPETFSFYD